MAIPQNLQASANSGNLSGTLAGALASMAVGAMAHAGYLAAAAAFVGCPETAVAGVAMVIVGAVVNYSATKISQVKTLNDLYNALPSSYPEYDAKKNAGSQTGKQ